MSEASDVMIVYCTVPDAATGDRLAGHLVEYRLAACVTQIPGVRSTYRWQGQVESATEALLMIKARQADYPALEEALCSLHPYELPEIVTVPVTGGLQAYLDWVRAQE